MPTLSQPKFELKKDDSGKFFINNEDAQGNHYTKELRLHSNTAETIVEIQAIPQVTSHDQEHGVDKHDGDEENHDGSQQKEDKDDEASKDLNGLRKERKIIL